MILFLDSGLNPDPDKSLQTGVAATIELIDKNSLLGR
jgi:hypothetical protein